MARQSVDVAVYAGTFENQPLVFAYLLDQAERGQIALNLDHVDVICKADPTARLSHVFPEKAVHEVTDMLDLQTTLVLIFPQAASTAFPAGPRLTHFCLLYTSDAADD